MYQITPVRAPFRPELKALLKWPREESFVGNAQPILDESIESEIEFLNDLIGAGIVT